MYAIFQDSGSQFKVSKGDLIHVDIRELPANATSVVFDQVLLIGGAEAAKIGSPTVPGAKVTAEIVRQFRDEKVTSIKFRRRGNYRRKKSHRQAYLQVRVTDIQG